MNKKEQFIGFDRHEYCPIIRPKTETLLKEVLLKQKPKQILEIGTFLGYSASVMLNICPDAFLTTIEKNQQNFEDAKSNLKEFGQKVQVVCCDAMQFLQECVSNKMKQYDFIFLDGPKGQYVKYLPMLKQILRDGGILMCDDILFYGLVQTDGKVAHKHRSIVNNLRKFLEDLQSDKDFETTIYEFEDGVSVSKKRRFT